MILTGTTQLSEYFCVNSRRVKEWGNAGIPRKKVGKKYQYDVAECKKWLRKNGYADYADTTTLKGLGRRIEEASGYEISAEEATEVLYKCYHMGMPVNREYNVKRVSAADVRRWMGENYEKLTGRTRE